MILEIVFKKPLRLLGKNDEVLTCTKTQIGEVTEIFYKGGGDLSFSRRGRNFGFKASQILTVRIKCEECARGIKHIHS